MLRRPHLMLPNARRNNHIVLPPRHLSIQLLNHLLRLHPLALFTLHERERVPAFPSLDLLVPLVTRRRRGLSGVDVREERGEVRDDVAEDGYRGVDDFVDVLGHDLEVDDAAGAFEGCVARSGGKG